MNNRLEINTSRKGTFKSSELSPVSAKPETFKGEKTDRLSKSFNASSFTAATGLNPQLPSPTLQRQVSFTEGDTPLVDISNLLHSLTFFSGLPSSDAFIKDITGLMKLRPFKAGDTVIRYGDEAKCMYLIVKGELGIISEDNEIEYATLTAGSFVGEIGVLFNSRRSATVVSKTKSLLVSLTSEDIHSKLEQYPEIKEHLQFTGTERLQAIEDVKNNNLRGRDGSGSDEKRGKAGFNVARSSSFRSFSPDSSFNKGQGGSLSASKNQTIGLLTPDSMILIKSRASSRRSSLNPETVFANSVDDSTATILTSEPAFTHRKTYLPVEDEDRDQLKLNKSFNASRRMSSIRFELGDLAVAVSDEASSTNLPQIEVSSDIADYQMVLENEPKNDIPVFNIKTPSMINLEQKEENITLPTFMIESPSMINLAGEEKLEKIESVVEKIESVEEKIESVEEKLKSKESEPRRISVAVWSDPKLAKMLKKEEGAQAPKQAKEWTSILSKDIGEEDESDVDEDELSFLQTSVGDSCDQDMNRITPYEDVLKHLLNYLSFEDVFKLRGMCLNMRDIITEVKPPKLRSIDLSPYFRSLNDRSVIAIAKLCGGFIERINLHASYQLTDRSIEKLAKFSLNLTHLNLSDVWELSDASINALSRYCPSLAHVDLSNCRKITNEGLLGLLESCLKLSVLSLSYCKNLSNKVFDHESWTRIRELNLHRCTGIKDRGFEFWPLLIDDLGWAGSGSRQLATSTDWGGINSEDNLKGSLYKSGGALDNISFGNDQTEVQLEDGKNKWDSYGSEEQLRDDDPYDSNSINFSGSVLINEISASTSDPSTITGFALRALDLRDCSFLSDSAIASIASVCSRLTTLNLSFCCSLTEDFGRYLGCKGLENLDVSYCGGAVTDEFIHEISTGLHRLKALSIRSCIQVTDEGVHHLLKYSMLTKINYTQCKGISPEGRDLLNAKYEIIENNSICNGIAGWK